LLWGPDDRQLVRAEMEMIVAMYWPPYQHENAVRIAQCESGWRTGAWNYTHEDSRGLFQINVDAHPQWATYNLFDPLVNAYFANQLWAVEGWQPWSCAKELGLG